MTGEAAGDPRSRIQIWMTARSPWQRRGIAAIAGAVATLGQAPFQVVPAYIVSIVLLVWLLDVSSAQTRRLRSAFATGWFFGLGYFVAGLYWVAAAFNVDSTAWGPVWGVPSTLALAAGLALFFAFGAVLAMLAWTNDIRRLAVFAVAFFISEWLRGNILTGFPWILPGYIWAPGAPISQLASLINIYGVSLLTLLIAAAPASIADGGKSAGARFAPVLVAALAVGMAWGWGAQRLASARVDPPGAQPIVRVADSGLSQAEKWETRPDQEWRVLDRYLDASGEPNDDNATSIVIWPEGAIPVVSFFALENPDFLSVLGRGLGDRVLIVGLTRRDMQANGLAYYNSGVVIDGVSGEARVSQIYDKHHLVPFGEYIPFWSLVSSFNIAPLQRIGAGFEAGPMPARLVVPGAPPATVLICYESIFPGMTPHGEGRPGWVVVLTNDSWFGGGSGPYQHYAMARYRAIEEGLPMARAASGGISAIVDAYGREVASTHAGGARSLFAEAQLPPALDETIAARWGTWLLLALLTLIGSLRLLPSARGPRGRRP